MKFEIQKEESCKKVYRVEFEKEEIQKAKKDAYNRNKNRYAIPGFRKGKVPMNVIEMHYGKNLFLVEAAEYMVNDAIREIVLTKEPKVVGEPNIDIVKLEGNDVVIDIILLTLPEVKIDKYTGFEIEAPNNEIDQEQVQAKIDELVANNTRYVKVDKAIENGYNVNIDFVGSIDGVEFEGGKAENHDLKIGSGSFIEGFEDQLIGKQVGEEVEVKVTFPEDYTDELKGKDASFMVKINSVEEPEMPEVNDDFISDTTDFDTLDEFKADAEKSLKIQKQLKDEQEVREAILGKILEANEIELTDEIIDAEVDRYIENTKNELKQMGIEYEQYLQILSRTHDDVVNEQRPVAEENLKKSLATMAIIDQEDIKVEDKDEAREIINKMLDLQGTDYEEIKDQLTDEYIESMNPQLVEFKLFEMLKEKNLKK